MQMWHWFAIMFALVALYHRKRLLATLRWHPAVWAMNIFVVVALGGQILLGVWLIHTWGGWGLLMFAGAEAVLATVVRLLRGRWFWQGDDDDVLRLD